MLSITGVPLLIPLNKSNTVCLLLSINVCTELVVTVFKVADLTNIQYAVFASNGPFSKSTSSQLSDVKEVPSAIGSLC